MKSRMMTLILVLSFVLVPHMALAGETDQTTVPSNDVQWQMFLDYDDRHPASLESLFITEVQRLKELAERPLEPQPESSPAEVAEEKTEPQRSQKESSSAVQEKPKPAPATTIEAKIHQIFGSHGSKAVRVAQCESGLNPRAYNGSDPHGGSYGLFQINGVHLKGFLKGHSANELYDPDFNIRAAYTLWRDQGWGPWACGNA